MTYDVEPDFLVEPRFEDYERLLAARVISVKSMLRPGLTNKDINDLADYAFSMCLHVEQQTGRTNTALVEEIYRCCSSCASVAPGRKNWLSPENTTGENISRTFRKLGVSRSIEETFEDIDVLDDIDLLAYALAFGMYVYVSTKIIDDPSVVRRSDGVPLLHLMTFSHEIFTENHTESRTWLELLQKLLENGADPNSNYRGETAWGYVFYT